MKINTGIIASALAASVAMGNAHASEVFEREQQRVIKKVDTILQGNQESYEYSVDNGLSWKEMAVGGAAILLILTKAGAALLLRKKTQPKKENTPDVFSTSMDWKHGDTLSDEEEIPSDDEESLSGYDAMIGSGIEEGSPVKEADVYLAYGRTDLAREVILEAIIKNPEVYGPYEKLFQLYALSDSKGDFPLHQIEALLLETIKKNPENTSPYKALLGIYMIRNDRVKFADMFIRDTSAHFRNAISEDDMKEVLEWGRKIDPENDLYIELGGVAIEKARIESQDPNTSVRVLYESSNKGERLESLELRTITSALQEGSLSEENILKASEMIVTRFGRSMNQEHQKNVETYLGKIVDIYTKAGQYDTAASYLLSESIGSHHAGFIHPLLTRIAPKIQDKKVFLEVYEYLLARSEQKITPTTLAELKKHGNTIDPKNLAFQSHTELKGAQEANPDKVETPQSVNTREAIAPVRTPDTVSRITPLETPSNKPEDLDPSTKPKQIVTLGMSKPLTSQLEKRGFQVERNEKTGQIRITPVREGSSLSILDKEGAPIEEIVYNKTYVIDNTRFALILVPKRNGIFEICLEGTDRSKQYIRINGTIPEREKV